MKRHVQLAAPFSSATNVFRAQRSSGPNGGGQAEGASEVKRARKFVQRPRFSRIFTLTSIGVPSKPNSSRIRRSTNRR